MTRSIQFARANFNEIEEFVGGDAEFRGGKMVVATPQGALWVEVGHWVVERDGVFTSEPQQPSA